MSDLCPLNLLGRDLMCTFNIVLTSTPDGLRISHNDASDITPFVKCSPTTPLYVYQWWLNHSVAENDLTEAASVISPASYCMKPDNLHCTAHVTIGPDKEFSKQFFRDINYSLTTSSDFD